MLDATARILERDGLRGLNLSSVAEEAGISRVTLHRRGVTVTQLVITVLRRASDELRELLWPVVTGPGSAAERLETAFTTLCDVVDRHAGPMAATFLVPPQPLPEAPERTTSLQFVEPFQRLLADGVVDGSLRSDDPQRDGLLLANAVCWTYLHMRAAHEWGRDDAVAGLVAMAMAGVRP